MENYLLLVVLPNLSIFFALVGLLGLLFTGGFFVCTYSDLYKEEDIENLFKSTGRIACYFLGMLFMSCFMPDRTQVIQLKVISTISELKGVEEIPQKMIDRINDLLDMGEKER